MVRLEKKFPLYVLGRMCYRMKKLVTTKESRSKAYKQVHETLLGHVNEDTV